MGRYFALVFILVASLGVPRAWGSVRRALVGAPLDNVLANGVCQGLLGYTTGHGAAEAIVRLRTHRVRTLRQAESHPAVYDNFLIDQNAGARDVKRLAEHLRGVERWTVEGHGEVYGMVFKTAAAIEGYDNKLRDLRATLNEGLDKDESLTKVITASRATMNLGTVVMLHLFFNDGVTPSSLAGLIWLLASNPVTANATLFRRDGVTDAFRDRVRDMVLRSQPDDWVFASRTYRVQKSVANEMTSRDLPKIVRAMNDQRWMDLNPVARRVMVAVKMLAEGADAAQELRARMGPSYIVVDQLIRFNQDTRQPELVVTVRLSDARPRKAFAPAVAPSKLPAAVPRLR